MGVRAEIGEQVLPRVRARSIVVAAEASSRTTWALVPPIPSGIDASPQWLLGAGPVLQTSVHIERAVREVDAGIWFLEVQGGGDLAVIKRQGGFDEAGDSGGDLQMADVRFDRSDGTEGGFGGAGAECLSRALPASIGSPSAVPVPWASTKPIVRGSTPDRASASFTTAAMPSWLGAR